MNKRFLELANDAGIGWGRDSFGIYFYLPDQGQSGPALEKFAELIVRECASIARDTNLEEVEGGDSAVLGAARDQILEHFGVTT
jgi:hypothetical protein